PEGPATLLVMPAWTAPDDPRPAMGVKIVSLMPGNPARGLPFILGAHVVLDRETGAPLALLDGPMLTARRTAAASALAARRLARPDARRLVVIGAGALAPHLARAHAAIRPIEEVVVWAREPAKAEALAVALSAEGMAARATTALAAAVAEADIVTAATRSRAPLIHGVWLRPGCHADLLGAFSPDMRESDDETIRRATVFVDTREGAMA